MNWHRYPELLDRLAADYALGTMNGGARRRFEAGMRQHAVVAQAATRWDARLAPLAAQLPALDPSDALWSRIEAQAFGGAAATPKTMPAPHDAASKHGSTGSQAWWQRWLAPLPAGALAFGLMLGLGFPLAWQAAHETGAETQLPESYVGVLGTAQGRPGLIVSSLRRGKTVDLKVVQALPLPAGSSLVLWTLDAKGVAQPVGTLPPLVGGFVKLQLPQPAEELFARAVELGVSLEAAGALPAAPALPFVYRGLCGKLWRVLPPAAAASRPPGG